MPTDNNATEANNATKPPDHAAQLDPAVLNDIGRALHAHHSRLAADAEAKGQQARAFHVVATHRAAGVDAAVKHVDRAAEIAAREGLAKLSASIPELLEKEGPVAVVATILQFGTDVVIAALRGALMAERGEAARHLGASQAFEQQAREAMEAAAALFKTHVTPEKLPTAEDTDHQLEPDAPAA